MNIKQLINQAAAGRYIQVDRDGPFTLKRQKGLIPDTGMASWVSERHGDIDRQWKLLINDWIKAQPEFVGADLHRELRVLMRDEKVLAFVRCEFNNTDNIALALMSYVRHAVMDALADRYLDNAEGGEYFESLFTMTAEGAVIIDNNLRILCGLLALVMRRTESERVG